MLAQQQKANQIEHAAKFHADKAKRTEMSSQQFNEKMIKPGVVAHDSSQLNQETEARRVRLARVRRHKPIQT